MNFVFVVCVFPHFLFTGTEPMRLNPNSWHMFCTELVHKCTLVDHELRNRYVPAYYFKIFFQEIHFYYLLSLSFISENRFKETILNTLC